MFIAAILFSFVLSKALGLGGLSKQMSENALAS